jgi:L-malate glycosyltransferase
VRVARIQNAFRHKYSSSYFEYLQQLTTELGIHDKVQFRGNQDPPTIASELSVSKVLALPSYMENSPNVIIEALAVGIPVVAYAVGGIPELIQDNFNGYLVRLGDIDEFAKKLKAIVSDSELFKRLSRNAMASVTNKHEPSIVSSKMYQAYLQILDDV